MQIILPPQSTRPQPVTTFEGELMEWETIGDLIRHDDGKYYDDDEINDINDYKVQGTEVYTKEYWNEAIKSMDDDDSVTVTFNLINNKRIPVSRGEDGIVVGQVKLKL
jgi:outer membrane translocation and assembly module TamA